MRAKRTKLRTYQFLNMASFRGRARLKRPSQWGSAIETQMQLPIDVWDCKL